MAVDVKFAKILTAADVDFHQHRATLTGKEPRKTAMADRRDTAEHHLAQLAMVKGRHAVQVKFLAADFFVVHRGQPCRVLARQYKSIDFREEIDFQATSPLIDVQLVPKNAPHKAKLGQHGEWAQNNLSKKQAAADAPCQAHTPDRVLE